jgi:hypothetical protein
MSARGIVLSIENSMSVSNHLIDRIRGAVAAQKLSQSWLAVEQAKSMQPEQASRNQQHPRKERSKDWRRIRETFPADYARAYGKLVQ